MERLSSRRDWSRRSSESSEEDETDRPGDHVITASEECGVHLESTASALAQMDEAVRAVAVAVRLSSVVTPSERSVRPTPM